MPREPKRCEFEGCINFFTPKYGTFQKYCRKHQLRDRGKFHFCICCGKKIIANPKDPDARQRFCSQDCFLLYIITGATYEKTEIKNKEMEMKKIEL
jgi:hypothetical protein